MIILGASVTLMELLKDTEKGAGQGRYEQIAETHY